MNEDGEIQCGSSTLNTAVDNILQVFQSHTEEVQELNERKWNLEVEIENLKKVYKKLEMEKSEIDADITRLKLQNAAYQKEHRDLRNAITVGRFQIEKIKEKIASFKANDLKALEDFEKAIDDITEKFRSVPDNYDRKFLMQKIEKEKATRNLLTKKLEELTTSYENFNREKGLRIRTDENEELLNCVLPNSPLFCYIEMMKTLDEIICEIKNLTDSQ